MPTGAVQQTIRYLSVRFTIILRADSELRRSRDISEPGAICFIVSMESANGDELRALIKTPFAPIFSMHSAFPRVRLRSFKLPYFVPANIGLNSLACTPQEILLRFSIPGTTWAQYVRALLATDLRLFFPYSN